MATPDPQDSTAPRQAPPDPRAVVESDPALRTAVVRYVEAPAAEANIAEVAYLRAVATAARALELGDDGVTAILDLARERRRQCLDDLSVGGDLRHAGIDRLTRETSPGERETILRAAVARMAQADFVRRESIRAELHRALKQAGVPSPAAFIRAAVAELTPPAADKAQEKDGPPPQGHALELRDPDPATESQDGAALLADLVAAIERHVVMPTRAATIAVALWIALTFALDAADVAPVLAVLSPEKRCGKTTLLRILAALCRRALAASNVSPAALYRVIERDAPSLLIDEADSFLPENEDLRGILNAGHTRDTAYVIRCIGDDSEPRAFGVFGLKALAAIGHLPGTIEDRAIIVRMRRRARGDRVERLTRARLASLAPLAGRLARWTTDNLDSVRAADPAIPDALGDRAGDNWRALIAIADAAGGPWPTDARAAAVELSGTPSEDAEGVRVMLLSDLRELFRERGTERIETQEILAHLCSLAERPWSEWGRPPRELKAQGLRSLLAPFQIRSAKWKDGAVTRRGYERHALSDAWARYLPLLDPPHPPPAGDHGGNAASDPPPAASSGGGSIGRNPESQPSGGGWGGSSPAGDGGDRVRRVRL